MVLEDMYAMNSSGRNTPVGLLHRIGYVFARIVAAPWALVAKLMNGAVVIDLFVAENAYVCKV